LLDLSVLQDTDSIGEAKRFVEIVSDEDGGLAQLPPEPVELGLQVRSGNRIECSERFIEQDHIRIGSESPGDSDSLPLSSGKFAWVALAECFDRETDEFEDFFHSLLASLQRPAKECGDEANVAGDVPMREEAAFLLDVTNLAPKEDGISFPDGIPLKTDFAGIGFDEAIEEAEEGGFARPTLADQSDEFTGTYAEVDAVEGDDIPGVSLRDTSAM